ncbi:hypothetical protein [Streptomyces sp. NPDC056544]|uniref:hypothetical protein n=1 Tax=unclassified Streptomyces TaxID=2593676 RepID=UPI0036D2F4AD
MSKRYEQAVKERTLAVLANIDGELCAQVAVGLGLSMPAATEPLVGIRPSPALSQIGRTWPVHGRTIGIVADRPLDMSGVREARQAVLDAGMVPLVITPAGGVLGAGGDPVTVQRTFATARSVEFDARLFVGLPGAGADAYGARDAKAGDPRPATSDPRVMAMLTEAYRHGKAIAGWGGAEALFETADISVGEPGVIVTDGVQALPQLLKILAAHRVWERFPATT